MKVFEKKGVRIVAGIAGASALLFALYQLWKHLPPRTPTPPQNEETQSEAQVEDEVPSDDEEHIPFDELIDDRQRQRMGKGYIGFMKYLRDINYRVIFCLLKGSSYQGIVRISFQLGQFTDEGEQLCVNFNGAGVKYLMVNGTAMNPRDIFFQEHRIRIPRELLRERGRNNIQVIFQSNYSFLNEGLCAYFTVDQNQKYSLRQQVIYSSNGYLEVERIIPCINCLNNCTVKVEVIHPDTFQVFSNASKSLERFCSVTQYHKYPFLFDLSSNSLNRSFKLNSSTVSANSMGDNSSQYSSSNFYNRKKANSHFYPIDLPSIHNLFIFSSAMMELLPQACTHPIQEAILIRYFCKHAESHRFGNNINKLHTFVLATIKKLVGEAPSPIHKLDILIISEWECQGNFTLGSIILSQKSLSQPLTMRCLYLIARAIVGVCELASGRNIVTLQQILALNQLVFNKFQEYKNYIYLKNQKHERIRNLISSSEKRQYINAHEGFFLKYYAKELKFIIVRNTFSNISSEFASLILPLKRQACLEFWGKLLSSYNFFPPLLMEPLIKLAVRRLKMPEDDHIRQQLKVAFNSSKYILSFYTNQEISDNLPKFIEYQAAGLEERLPQLKVKQKFKDFITQRYEKFLPIKSNIAEAEAIYNQFKKFNQTKNFHPHALLKEQVRRVACFGTSFMQPQRVRAECSVAGWKLLRHIMLYPADEDYFNFLRNIDDIQQV